MNEREFTKRAMGCAERLWRISYLILRNEADCDDAVQEALLKAWAKRDTLRDPAYFETWLVRILINCARSGLRNRPRAAEPLDERMAAAPPPNPALREAIRALELKYRLPLVLHHLEGYPIDACAAMLKLPETTVKWRLHAARRQLRELLEEEERA